MRLLLGPPYVIAVYCTYALVSKNNSDVISLQPITNKMTSCFITSCNDTSVGLIGSEMTSLTDKVVSFVPPIRFMAAFLAATFFRPDNTATLGLFHMETILTERNRQIIHGILMTLSAVLLDVYPYTIVSISVLYVFGKFHNEIVSAVSTFKCYFMNVFNWGQSVALYFAGFLYYRD